MSNLSALVGFALDEPLPPLPDAEGGAFPLVLHCERGGGALLDALAWLATNAPILSGAATDFGAVLLRGLPVGTAEDFDAVVQAFGWPGFPYAESLSNAVRTNLTPWVFTANEAPAEATIGLHHEMAQTPIHPSRLFFFCEKPAERGGATSLCRSDRLHERLVEQWPGFVADCAAHGLRYSLVMPPEDDPESPVGRSWRNTFGCDDRVAVEARMKALGYEWAWLDGGCLRTTTPVLPAVKRVGPGRHSLFSQLIAARSWKDARNAPRTAVCFGDGRPLPDDAWAAVAEIASASTVDLLWEQGDVALVDNFVTMHGRRPFEGTRRVLASLVPKDAP